MTIDRVTSTRVHYVIHRCEQLSRQHISATIQALTRGGTDHFAAVVTYLQFSIHVCFSSTLPDLVFQVSLSLLTKKERFLLPAYKNFDRRT